MNKAIEIMISAFTVFFIESKIHTCDINCHLIDNFVPIKYYIENCNNKCKNYNITKKEYDRLK